MKAALLTGASGALGISLLRELCESGDFARIRCLVRDRAARSGRQRLEEHARLYGVPLPESVECVDCDLRQPRLGMDDQTYERLTRDTTHVFHSAADVRFNQSIDVMRRTNVEGTRAILEFCAHARAVNPDFALLTHISTAYVAGRRRGTASDDVLDDRVGFRNTYERSKFEAERLVRSQRGQIPTVIFRPSIIWNLDGAGYLPTRSAAYPAIRLYQRWPLAAIPVTNNTLDIVPVEFVARAIARLSSDGCSVGRCFHLTAGPRGDVSLGRFYGILGSAFRAAGHDKTVYRLPSLIGLVYWQTHQHAFKSKIRSGAAWDAYFPYLLNRNPRFSIANTAKALERHGITIPTSEAVLRGTLTRVAKGLLR